MILPSRKAKQRKPSHFGSYCHSLPWGIASTDNASIGGKGGRISSGILHYRKPRRIKPHPAILLQTSCLAAGNALKCTARSARYWSFSCEQTGGRFSVPDQVDMRQRVLGKQRLKCPVGLARHFTNHPSCRALISSSAARNRAISASPVSWSSRSDSSADSDSRASRRGAKERRFCKYAHR